jgi:hypothetical protein
MHAEAKRVPVRQIKSVRLKTVDPVASTHQFRLGDGEIDLLKALSLVGSDGIGSAWKVKRWWIEERTPVPLPMPEALLKFSNRGHLPSTTDTV